MKKLLIGLFMFSFLFVGSQVHAMGAEIYTSPIKVLSPNGGETYTAGQQIAVKWEGGTNTSNVLIRLSNVDSNGYITNQYQDLISSTLNDGQELVTLPVVSVKTNYKIQVRQIDSENSDYTDNAFTVNPQVSTSQITILSPNGGEVYQAGQQITVTWSTYNATVNDQVMIILKSNQTTFGAEITTVPNTGTAIITLPTTLGGGQVSVTSGHYYKIRLELGGNAMNHIAPSDESNNLFTINSANNVCANGATNYPTCTINNTLPIGCTSTSGYSPITGAKCDGYVNNEGCQMGDKFSSTTGRACVTIIAPPTCSSSGVGCGSNTTNSSTSTSISRTLRKGMKGDDVKILQLFLNLATDGSFGPETQAKVIEWQKENGLTPDGVFGNMSRQKANLSE